MIYRNNYIPISRKTLVRELLQDVTVIHSNERDIFELFAVSLEKEIRRKFMNVHKDLMILLNPSPPAFNTAFVETSKLTRNTDLAQKLVSSNITEPNQTLRRDRLDGEFWMLRRLADVTSLAGFNEVPLDAIKDACLPRARKGIFTYIDAGDYDVMRFWTRGLHPTELYSKSSGVIKSTLSGSNADGMCHGHVLMAVRPKQDDVISLRLFRTVPLSSEPGYSTPEACLIDLLPIHREAPRKMVRPRLHTGVEAAYLFSVGGAGIALAGTSFGGAVTAWGIATSATALATLSRLYMKENQAMAKWQAQSRRMLYNCTVSSGAYALNSIVNLACEETYKSTLLAYALLLQPGESGASLSGIQLESRVRSWLSKRLHESSNGYGINKKSSESNAPWERFSGGGRSATDYDFMFNTRNLSQVLAQLELLQKSPLSGEESGQYKVIPLQLAVEQRKLSTAFSESPGPLQYSDPYLQQLWLQDPVIDEIDFSRTAKR